MGVSERGMAYFEFIWTDEIRVKRKARRVERSSTSDERARHKTMREQIAKETPSLIERDQLRKDAREEATMSGQLRRAIIESDLTLSAIAKQAGITPIFLDDFLTGERTLRSDVINRLMTILGYELSPVE
jgi:hypothetical protein